MSRIIIALAIIFVHSSVDCQQIISENGDSLDVQEGTLSLPENRMSETTNTVTLSYQVATSKNSENGNVAIFMLAGGPGGSWLQTASLQERFDEIRMYQQFADVVIYDQRGAGKSIPNLDCKDVILNKKIDHLDSKSVAYTKRELATECRDHWLNMGVDLSAYNTAESTEDLEDLRQHLGYDQLVLVGGSYGSHLGLNYIKKYPDKVKCAIFHGIEGPDHTLDMPSQVLNAYKRIATATESSAYYSLKLKGKTFLELHEHYLKSLKHSFDESSKRLIANFIFRYKAGDRNNLSRWADNLLNLYEGESGLSQSVKNYLTNIIAPHAMNNVMDFSSWATPERIAQIRIDSGNYILGPINNIYFDKDSIWPVNDLGNEFRGPMSSQVPVLLIHGTWDISTPIENALEMHEQLSNSKLIVVKHGSHDAYYELLEEWSPMKQRINDFLNDKYEKEYNETTLKLEFPEVFDERQIAFWDAVIEGDVSKVSKIIEEDIDINLLDTRTKKTGRTALNWAAWYGNLEMIELLLRYGAQINLANKSGYTPIHHAIENCKFDAVHLLLERGADLSIPSLKGVYPKETAQESCPEVNSLIQE